MEIKNNTDFAFKAFVVFFIAIIIIVALNTQDFSQNRTAGVTAALESLQSEISGLRGELQQTREVLDSMNLRLDGIEAIVVKDR